MMEADIEAAAPEKRLDAYLNGMWELMGELVHTVHRLETGEPPPIVYVRDENA